jgi:hypothetical protein
MGNADTGKQLPSVQLNSILQSARHRSIANAATYQKDSSTQLAILTMQGGDTEDNAVSTWISIAFEATDTVRRLTLVSHIHQKELPDLSRHFVFNTLGIVLSDSTPLPLVLLAANRAQPTSASRVVLDSMLDSAVAPTLAGTIKDLFTKSVKEEVEQKYVQLYEQLARTQVEVASATETVRILSSQVKRRVKKNKSYQYKYSNAYNTYHAKS